MDGVTVAEGLTIFVVTMGLAAAIGFGIERVLEPWMQRRRFKATLKRSIRQ